MWIAWLSILAIILSIDRPRLHRGEGGRGRAGANTHIAARSAEAYNLHTAIQSTTLGRAELSCQEAERFLRHMTEDKPNLATKALGRA